MTPTSKIMRATTSKTDLVDAAELELALLLRDTVENEATLGVVQQAEQVSGLLDLHHVCRNGQYTKEVG